MDKEVRKKALSAVMTIFNRAALKSTLSDDEEDKKKMKKTAKKPDTDGTEISSIAKDVVSESE